MSKRWLQHHTGRPMARSLWTRIRVQHHLLRVDRKPADKASVRALCLRTLRPIRCGFCAAIIAILAIGPANTSAPAIASVSLQARDVVDQVFDGTHIGDYVDQSAPGAVKEVPNPLAGGQSVFEMTVSNNDVYPITPTANPRAQLLSPAIFTRGYEFWMSMKFLLPSDFPEPVPGWVTVLEGPYGPPYAGTPPWHIAASDDYLEWERNRTYDHDVPWRMPLVRGAWVDVLLHERFAPNGWVEMWVNGQPITFFGSGTSDPNGIAPTQRLVMKTMDSSNDRGPNSAYIQSYRKAGTLPSVSLYQAPILIGTTRASVEE